MSKISEGYGLGFTIDTETHNNSLVIVKRLLDGNVEVVRQIKGKEVEDLYERLIKEAKIIYDNTY